MLESIFLIVFLGFLISRFFNYLRLPGLLGMIIFGMTIGPHGLGLIDESIMNISSDIRLLALIVILLRAGLGINKDTLKSVGSISLKMSAIPCLMEGFAIMFVANRIMGLTYIESGILGFTIAAVSPAVIVPAMISLRDRKLGMDKGIPIIILAGASIDDVFAIALFTGFLGMYFGESFGIWNILNIPIQIVAGILFGIIMGYIVSMVYKSDRIFKDQNEKLLFTLVVCIGLILVEKIFNISGLIAVMTVGFYLLNTMKDKVSYLEKSMGNIWFFAQIFLFVLIGAQVDISVIPNIGLNAIIIIGVGLIFRGFGVFISLINSNLNGRERLFCAISYIPKATVQAAIGAIPLSRGVESGELILAMSVLAILLTAPIGSILMEITANKLLN